jgi:antibiotic biosynthesis monooxygenase (ABM) superfamily enzyme
VPAHETAGPADGTAGAVTVAVTRHVDPREADQMVAWVRAGAALAERFPGFLGFGWVRPAGTSDRWDMLYRFADASSLAAWEASPQRRWWLDAAQGMVGESRVERRTGIEGWFDPPARRDVEDLRPSTPAPPRWKQAVLIWSAFFPLSLAVGTLVDAVLPPLPVWGRLLLVTVVMTPLMVYLVLPRLTSALGWWLHGRPAPRRRR